MEWIRKPKILVVGSMRDLEGKVQKDFQQACRSIGAALGRRGHEIIIGSERPVTADRYVVEGLASVDGKRHRVWVIRPDDGGYPFSGSELEKTGRIELCSERLRSGWSAGRVPQILAADVVLLIGGSTGGLTAGQVAPALQKPILAVASFGGAAKELWPDLAPFYRRLGKMSTRVSNLCGVWQPDQAELVVDALEALVRRNPFRTTPRLPLGFYMFSLVALLATWVWLFTMQLTDRSQIPLVFFSMLGVAGLLGTMLRNNLRLMNDPTATFSWNELAIELGAGLILAFALALLYLVGAIAIKDADSPSLLPTGPDNFQRVAVIMTLLGLGGGLMIEQASRRVRGWYLERLGDRPPDG